MVNQQVLAHHWDEVRQQLCTKWKQLKEDDLPDFPGNVDQLIGRIQQKTGVSRETIEAYLATLSEEGKSVVEDVRQRVQQGAAKVAATARELAADPGRRQVALRTLARTAGDLDEVAWLQAQAGDDVDLRWRALARKAELGGAVDAEIDALLGVDPNPEAWVRATTARAAAPDPAAKEAAWNTVVVARSVPIGDVKQVTATFWRPGQDALLAPYAERYLDLAPQLHRGGMTPAMVFANRLFPIYAVDEAYLGRAEAVAVDAAPVVGKYMTERIDVVRRMLRARV